MAATEIGEYLEELNEKCKIREIQIYLSSKGRGDEARKIESLEDKLACSIIASHEFRNKGWILRPHPGPYDDYQRLYVGDIHYRDDELIGKYCNLYFTYGDDLAFKKIFKELQSLITWDLSWSDAQRIGEDASTKYKDLQPHILEQTVQETLTSKKWEHNMKERVPLCTKLWQEVVTKEEEPLPVPYTYADYLEEKMQIAANLGLRIN